MAKGGKKKSKYDDDWENEIGEDLTAHNDNKPLDIEDQQPKSDSGRPEDSIQQASVINSTPEEPISSFKLKSKKEKEKEKKERQKVQKKADTLKLAKNNTQDVSKTTLTQESIESDPVEHKSNSKNVAQPQKLNPRLAMLQAKLEKQKEAERQRQLEEEAEKKRLEEILLAEEEAKRKKEEAAKKRKEKEKAKVEMLKASGQYLTKKQREQLQLQEIRRKQMLESKGIVIEALKVGEQSKIAPKKYTKRPKKPNSDIVVSESGPEAKPHDEPEAEIVEKQENIISPEPEPEPKEDFLESWEDEINQKLKESNLKDIQKQKEKIIETKPHEESVTISIDNNPVKTPAKKITSTPESKGLNTKSKSDTSNIRSPIVCIMGHVDTGKTKLLDNIRSSNVQENEAGGITQQIGATWFPIQSIEKRILPVNQVDPLDLEIPGILIIDTPGHESFANLRSRGSSLCNLAILVIDITHGLEQQTLESIALLKSKKTPFIVALNKVDRLYGWIAMKNSGFEHSLANQNKACQRQFEEKLKEIKLALAEQGLNSELSSRNQNFAKYVSICPTSAHSGEGIPDLLKLLVYLTQKKMAKQLQYQEELECTILEVKVVEGLGTTVDCILSNGTIREGDRIIVCGLNGPIVTNIRALLTPEPMVETRIKTPFVQHKEIKAAMGVKIAANDLDKVIAGSRLLLCKSKEDEERLKVEVMQDLEDIMNAMKLSDQGVSVQASTLGSLEALLAFLNQMKVPVSTINIGPVFKKDVIRCGSMLEKAPEYGMMLCFDVKIDKDAEQLAEQLGIKIFVSNIIYHLFDSFQKFQQEGLEKKRQDSKDLAVFPCVLKVIAAFNKKDPIILGVDVLEGVLRVGTPLCAVRQGQIIDIGRIVSAEMNHKPVDKVRKGQAGGGVAISIEGQDQILFGRQVESTDLLYSHISRETINTLKDPAFRNEVSKDEWKLIISLKSKLNVM